MISLRMKSYTNSEWTRHSESIALNKTHYNHRKMKIIIFFVEIVYCWSFLKSKFNVITTFHSIVCFLSDFFALEKGINSFNREVIKTLSSSHRVLPVSKSSDRWICIEDSQNLRASFSGSLTSHSLTHILHLTHTPSAITSPPSLMHTLGFPLSK